MKLSTARTISLRLLDYMKEIREMNVAFFVLFYKKSHKRKNLLSNPLGDVMRWNISLL